MESVWCWINSNDAGIIAIATVIYVIATIAICFANFSSADKAKKQLTEMINQQKQNVGISLYEKRKNLIEELKYASGQDIAHINKLEVEFLFDSEIQDLFYKLLIQVDKLIENASNVKEYEDMLREDSEDFYYKFCILRNQLCNEDDLEKLLKYCDDHIFSYGDEISGYKKLNYRIIYTDITKLEYLISCNKEELIQKMIGYVKEEIGVYNL